MIPNKTYLAWNYEHEQSWQFMLECDATVLEEQLSELLSILEIVFECSRPLLRFKTCVVSGVDYGPEVRLSDTDRRQDTREFDRYTRRIANSDGGLEYSDVEQLITDLSDSEPITYVNSVSFPSVETYVELEGFSGYLDRTDERFKFVKKGEMIDEEPSDDPVTLELSNTVGVTADEVTTSTVHELTLKSNTDIWFDETTEAAANRHRMVSTLKCFESQLDDGDRYLHGNRITEWGIEQAKNHRPEWQSLVPWRDFTEDKGGDTVDPE